MLKLDFLLRVGHFPADLPCSGDASAAAAATAASGWGGAGDIGDSARRMADMLGGSRLTRLGTKGREKKKKNIIKKKDFFILALATVQITDQ